MRNNITFSFNFCIEFFPNYTADRKSHNLKNAYAKKLILFLIYEVIHFLADHMSHDMQQF